MGKTFLHHCNTCTFYTDLIFNINLQPLFVCLFVLYINLIQPLFVCFCLQICSHVGYNVCLFTFYSLLQGLVIPLQTISGVTCQSQQLSSYTTCIHTVYTCSGIQPSVLFRASSYLSLLWSQQLEPSQLFFSACSRVSNSSPVLCPVWHCLCWVMLLCSLALLPVAQRGMLQPCFFSQLCSLIALPASQPISEDSLWLYHAVLLFASVFQLWSPQKLTVIQEFTSAMSASQLSCVETIACLILHYIWLLAMNACFIHDRYSVLCREEHSLFPLVNL